MPPDLPQHRPPRRIKPWWKVLGKPRVTLYPKEELSGFSETAEYPPIKGSDGEAYRTEVRYNWYDQLRELPTVEQKFHEIGRHKSQRIAYINNWLPLFNALPAAKYMTQTHIINSLPESWTQQSQVNSDLMNNVKESVLSQIALDRFQNNDRAKTFVSKSVRDGNKQSYKSNLFVQNLTNNVKRILAAEQVSELLDYKYDLSPAVNSWFYQNCLKPNNKRYYINRVDENDMYNQMIQIQGSSAMNIRSKNFLEPAIDPTDPLVTESSLIEPFTNKLYDIGARYVFKQPYSLPGYWYHEESGFDMPHTCLLTMDCLQTRKQIYKNLVNHELKDEESCLMAQTILSAFSWTNGLAQYHGFTPFHPLEYPFTCQVITTNGREWIFSVYQLNSHVYHRDLLALTPKKINICYTTNVMQLFDEYKDGSFSDINEDVLKLLICFLSRKPSAAYTEQLNLRPHLGEDTRSEEEREKDRVQVRRIFEQRVDPWFAMQWKVPLWEHVFFRHPLTRKTITHMKTPWHVPIPKTPKIFN